MRAALECFESLGAAFDAALARLLLAGALQQAGDPGARAAWLDANLDRVRAFLAETAAAFPVVEAWGAAEWQRYVSDLPGRNAEEEQQVWQATLPLMKGSGPLFRHDHEALRGLSTLLLQAGSMREEVPLAEAFRDLL